jgi:hypothetical protein
MIIHDHILHQRQKKTSTWRPSTFAMIHHPQLISFCMAGLIPFPYSSDQFRSLLTNQTPLANSSPHDILPGREEARQRGYAKPSELELFTICYISEREKGCRYVMDKNMRGANVPAPLPHKGSCSGPPDGATFLQVCSCRVFRS